MPRDRAPTAYKLREPHNPATLQWLLTTGLRQQPEGKGRPEASRMLRDLLSRSKKSKNGAVVVEYAQLLYAGEPVGRMHDTGHGMQALWRKLRGAVARDMTRRLRREVKDLDIAKCHPTLFPQVCRRIGALATNVFLGGYTDDPDAFFAVAKRDAGASEGQAKNLVNSLLNFGGIGGWLHEQKLACSEDSELYRTVTAAAAEIASSVKGCMAADPALLDLAKRDLAASGWHEARPGYEMKLTKRFQYLQMSRVENECLRAAADHVRLRSGHELLALVFDGLVAMLVAGLSPEQVAAATAKLCSELSQAVKEETGYEVRFADKPWDADITVPDDLPEFSELTDVSAAKLFLGWLAAEGHRLLRCGGAMFLYDAGTGLYSDVTGGSPVLRRMMSECEDIQAYGQSVAKQKLVEVALQSHCDVDHGFLLNAGQSTKGRIVWRNGVLDLATKTLLPFSPDIVLFGKLPHDYPVGEEAIARAAVLVRDIDRRAVEPIWGENAEFVKQLFARAIAGHVEDKRFVFAIGESNAGKGVWMAAMKSGFGDYTGSINSGCLVSRREDGDQAKARSWMLVNKDRRVLFSSEVRTAGTIDGTIIKELSTGGEPTLARTNNRDEVEFVMSGTVFVFANDLGKISGAFSDEAVMSRLVFLPMPHQHLTGDDYARALERAKAHEDGGKNSGAEVVTVREGDPHIKDWLARPEVGAAFAYMLCNSYVGTKPEVPDAVAANTEDWLKGEEVSDNVVLDVLMKQPDGEVSVTDVVAAIVAKGESMSANKIAREVWKHFKVKSRVAKASERKSVRMYKGLVLK